MGASTNDMCEQTVKRVFCFGTGVDACGGRAILRTAKLRLFFGQDKNEYRKMDFDAI